MLKSFPRALRHCCTLPLLVLPALAHAADQPANQIIALPLNPVVQDGLRSCAAKTASGLGYTVLRPAEGAKPEASDIALIGYIGYLAANGTVFDQDPQTALPVDRVVPGFSEGLKLMAKGSVYRFCLPPALGYGAAGAGPIPPNSDLVFQVEMFDFKTAAEVEEMRKAAEAAPSPAPEQPAKPGK